MKWRLFANLAEAAGRKEIEVDVEPGATYREAFDALLAEHPDLEPELLDEDGNLLDHVRTLRNDRDPFEADEGWETRLEAGDELALFPPVSGG
jgi:molybdopterin synthase sulfur carrier subunit